MRDRREQGFVNAIAARTQGLHFASVRQAPATRRSSAVSCVDVVCLLTSEEVFQQVNSSTCMDAGDEGAVVTQLNSQTIQSHVVHINKVQ